MGLLIHSCIQNIFDQQITVSLDDIIKIYVMSVPKSVWDSQYLSEISSCENTTNINITVD